MQKGLEINFYDLFRYLLKKWAVLLAFVLVFGIGANFYGYHRATAAAERERRALEAYAQSLGTTPDALPEYMTVELAELRGALTEEEASFVEAAAKLYMYRMWASDRINAELIVGDPDHGDLEVVQTLYYANEGVQSATQVMTSAEKSYYNVLVKRLSGMDMSVTEREISVPGKLQPKWLVIGCALGAFLGICVTAMSYILSGRLRTAEDMERPYGVPVLAAVKPEETEKIRQTVKGISRLLKEKKLETMAVCAADTPAARELSERMTEQLREMGVKARTANGDASGFIGDIAETDAVLFIEQIGKSPYREIEYRVTACRKFCIPTAGCVVIK